MPPRLDPRPRLISIRVKAAALACLLLPGVARVTQAADAPGHMPTPRESPLTAEEQLSTFSVPDGYQVELVAAEPDGGKFIAIAFDHAGRMWTMTALEYPLDANEAGPEARALFAGGGRDRVLVFDTPTRPGRQRARTFAEGLVMPLGLLPWKHGAFVQYGDAIRFYTDADQDGRAEGFTNVLTGFGIEDSHLFPHQFTRAPGGWLWLAQGAFNYSKVRTTADDVTDFNKTKLARWRPDGSRFEVIGWGPCNIWGLVIDRLGEAFIQEANDQRWPVMPFLEGASYPLCGDDVPRPYAPPFPKTGEQDMGGTGLSGLAYSEGGDCFPGEWRDVFFIANPITCKIQAIRVHRNGEPANKSSSESPGNGWRLEHLPDFVLSSDPWFRPVALAFGPDGCLYIVDWYNKIISHNEVPRTHPERDKTRGRIWRVRHASQPHRVNPPDLYRASEAGLLVHLRATNTWEATAAWHEIVDRQATVLAPQLGALLMNDHEAVDARLRALWCLEELGRLEPGPLGKLLGDSHRAARKESLRALRELRTGLPPDLILRLAREGLSDPDRLVRQEAIRLLLESLPPSAAPESSRAIVELLIQAGANAPEGGWAKAPGYFRDFERYLIRKGLENQAGAVRQFLDQPPQPVAIESMIFASLTLGGAESGEHLARWLPQIKRELNPDEFLLIAAVPHAPGVGDFLKTALTHQTYLRMLLGQKERLANAAGALAPLLAESVRGLVTTDPGPASDELLVQIAAAFNLTGLDPELIRALDRPDARTQTQVGAIRALRESGSAPAGVFARYAVKGSGSVQREAVLALASSKSDTAIPVLLETWPLLGAPLRRVAADRMSASPGAARQLVGAIRDGIVLPAELDSYVLEKLSAVLPDDADVHALVARLNAGLKPVLRLDGGDGDYVDTEIRLNGPFTVECWVRLDPGINNHDSLLASPDQFDANFHDSRFRLWLGGGLHDVVVSTRPVAAESWTHVALTRDDAGAFRIYLNGELDATSQIKATNAFSGLVPGRSNPAGGTAGEFAEFRVWKTCRTGEQIRADANLALDPPPAGQTSATKPPGFEDLIYHGSGGSWGRLHGAARILRVADPPPLQTASEAKALESTFNRFRALGARPADAGAGRLVFDNLCLSCHTIGGAGGKIGPALDGAGANGIESLLRNILTPNAAMEAGYRRYQIETRDGEIHDGLFVADDDQGILLRQVNGEEIRIPRSSLRRAGFSAVSLMPEGLIEPLPADDAANLLAFLQTLK